MRYPSRLVEGRFVRRYKRFFCDVAVDGEVLTAHLANTGRMTGCTAPSAPVRLSKSDNPRRKLRWSVEQIQVGGHWICVNSARPNRVVEEAVRDGRVPELRGHEAVLREQRLGDSRVDLKLVGPGICWVEIKNATLLDGSTVVFPDTVSARATRHLGALRQAVERGERAVLLFHVGHEGGVEVRAASQIDPTYARALREAVGAGVEVLAYRARMSDAEIVLDGALPFTP